MAPQRCSRNIRVERIGVQFKRYVGVASSGGSLAVVLPVGKLNKYHKLLRDMLFCRCKEFVSWRRL